MKSWRPLIWHPLGRKCGLERLVLPMEAGLRGCLTHLSLDSYSIETATQAKKSGHFTKCPKELRQYCIHGSCRFVKEQNTPSCRCERGYIGSRCEYVDLASRLGDKRQIIVACVIAVLVFLILLITFICICAHRHKLCRRKRGRKEEMRNGTEKLNMIMMMNTNGMHVASDSVETSDTNAV
uniref:Betacellulin, epidermal growth factor family member n=1 Tax=Oncorhynchus kisutch TaxID=8019 RepID=A0A8C7GLP7_ONCKI